MIECLQRVIVNILIGGFCTYMHIIYDMYIMVYMISLAVCVEVLPRNSCVAVHMQTGAGFRDSLGLVSVQINVRFNILRPFIKYAYVLKCENGLLKCTKNISLRLEAKEARNMIMNIINRTTSNHFQLFQNKAGHSITIGTRVSCTAPEESISHPNQPLRPLFVILAMFPDVPPSP